MNFIKIIPLFLLLGSLTKADVFADVTPVDARNGDFVCGIPTSITFSGNRMEVAMYNSRRSGTPDFTKDDGMYTEDTRNFARAFKMTVTNSNDCTSANLFSALEQSMRQVESNHLEDQGIKSKICLKFDKQDGKPSGRVVKV